MALFGKSRAWSSWCHGLYLIRAIIGLGGQSEIIYGLRQQPEAPSICRRPISPSGSSAIQLLAGREEKWLTHSSSSSSSSKFSPEKVHYEQTKIPEQELYTSLPVHPPPGERSGEMSPRPHLPQILMPYALKCHKCTCFLSGIRCS